MATSAQSLRDERQETFRLVAFGEVGKVQQQLAGNGLRDDHSALLMEGGRRQTGGLGDATAQFGTEVGGYQTGQLPYGPPFSSEER